jgi:hypothetical protein
VSLVDRINRRLVERIRGKAPRVRVQDGALHLPDGGNAERRLSLASLVSATLLHRDIFVGDVISLHLRFPAGESIEVAMDDPAWPALVAALDATGRIAVPARVWQTQAIADGPGAPPRELIAQHTDQHAG